MADNARLLSPPPLTVRIRRYLLQLLLLGLAVHLLLPQLTTFDQSVQVIKSMAPWAVAVAVVSQVLSYLGSGYLLQTIVALVGDRLSIARGMLITLAASSIGLLAGGVVGTMAATYRWVRGSSVSAEGAGLAAWLPNLFFNNAAMAGASVFGLVHLLMAHELSPLEVIGFSLVLLLLSLMAAGFLWGLSDRPRLTRLSVHMATRWAKLGRRPYNPETTEAALGRLFIAWDALRSGGWVRPVLGALFNMGFDMLTLYFLFVAAGHAVTPGILLVGYGLPQLLAKVTILPGGVGVVEGAMAALYHSLGVPEAINVVVILSYRVISFWLPTLLGFPLILYLQSPLKKKGDTQRQSRRSRI
jgi:uncharacterized protein (TIRG00374 family)